MMRKILFSILVNDAGIYGIVGNRVYEHGSVPDHPQKPFIMTKFLDIPRTVATRVKNCSVEIWFYGPENDYSKIERGLHFVEQAIQGRTGVFADEVGIGRMTLIEGHYDGAGPDLNDLDYRATLKIANCRLVGSLQ